MNQSHMTPPARTSSRGYWIVFMDINPDLDLNQQITSICWQFDKINQKYLFTSVWFKKVVPDHHCLVMQAERVLEPSEGIGVNLQDIYDHVQGIEKIIYIENEDQNFYYTYVGAEGYGSDFIAEQEVDYANKIIMQVTHMNLLMAKEQFMKDQ